MHGLRIVALVLIALVGYGVLHDQVAVWISPEYFSIGHVDLFSGASPFLNVLLPSSAAFLPHRMSLSILAFRWGVIDSWFLGLLLGLGLTAAARLGRRPKLTAAVLRRAVCLLVLSMAACAAVAGLTGALLAISGQVSLPPRPFEAVPANGHSSFLGVYWMHAASAAIGLVGGLVLIVWAWRKRGAVVEAV